MDVGEFDPRNNLAVGTVLQLNGYEDPKYVIVKNNGVNPKFPAYGAKYDLINLADGSRRGTNSLELLFIAQKQDNRIQMYITKEVLDADGIMDAFKFAEAKNQERLRESQAKDQAKAAELDSFKIMYADLERAGGRKVTQYALGASNLRKELKKAFPGTKFSVTSEGFSMGCAIRVGYTDGPTRAEVEAISDKYEYGTFDSMTDCAGYKDEQFTEVFGGAKFVTVNRDTTKEADNG